MYKKCKVYFDQPIAEILALDDELRRNTLEYLARELIRAHGGPAAIVKLTTMVRAAEELNASDFDDEDDFTSEVLDRATDDEIAGFIENLRNTGTAS